MDSSPFTNLPLELRLDIYELLLYEAKPFQLSRETGRHKKNLKDYILFTEIDLSTLTAVMKTCKQIREEAMPVFFRLNVFTISPRVWQPIRKWTVARKSIYAMELTACKRWLKSIGPKYAAAIRFLGVESWCWSFAELGSTPSKDGWMQARKIEEKLLKNTAISLHSIYAILKIRIAPTSRSGWAFRQEYPSHSPSRPWCSACSEEPINELALVKFVLPSRNKALSH